MRLCIFDLDHTLVSSSLDLVQMAADMRAVIERELGPLPVRPERYRVGELITHCQRRAPALEARVWAVALEHEQRTLGGAALEPGALEAVTGVRARGFATAVWTNNARSCTVHLLERLALAPYFDLVVTRDELGRLKPDPDGFRLIRAALPPLAEAVVIGDSWVDGLAAARAGIPFIAYRADPTELARQGVVPRARIGALSELLSALDPGPR